MRSVLFLSYGIALVGAVCHHGTKAFARRAEEAAAAPSFGYTGGLSPLMWHTLAAENTLCNTGKTQSPISVTADNSKPVEGSTLAFDVANFPEGGELENLGTTVEVPANGTMSLGDKAYTLAQFHFHTPSEHRIQDEYYPMEVHFVFEAEDASLAVVGLMVEAAAMEVPADFIRSVFMNIDQVPDAGTVAPTAPLDFTLLKEHVAKSTVWQYSGSLTTPSCDENVAWNVVEQPMFIDATLYRKVKSVVKFNSRYTQAEPGTNNFLDQSGESAAPVAAPVAEAPVAEAPVAEAPVAEAPVAEAPVAEGPVTEATVQAPAEASSAATAAH